MKYDTLAQNYHNSYTNSKVPMVILRSHIGAPVAEIEDSATNGLAKPRCERGLQL